METKAEQYYPTYKSENRDILLVEFEEAQKIANGQNKVYGQVTNILLATVTFAFTFLISQEEKPAATAQKILSTNSILFAVILFIFGAILLRYFVDLQKQITINARKAVTLRTLLGLDYGHIHLTLPNWRVEGATNPFAIKYFNGWFNFKSMPFWLITITINVIWWLTTTDKPAITVFQVTYPIKINWFWGNISITATYYLVFRRNLNDKHETTFLNLIKTFSMILRIKLVENFEYILYRAKLSFIELDRLKVNSERLEIILVDIEDHSFFSNNGISVKSLLRGALSRLSFIREKLGIIENGGSTITMQLSRTLFIPSNQNKYFRKIIEILLSLWLNYQFQKKEILKFYISSVRYERGILGLSNAIKYFFGDLKEKDLSNEEAFFLVERLSNISSTVNWKRIEHLKSRTETPMNAELLRNIYEEQIRNGRLNNYA